MTITISNELLEILPDFNVLAYSMDVRLEDSSVIEGEIRKTEELISEEYTLEEVLCIPLIKEARDSYKKLGKDPSRYRLACESLLRRIVKGNSLYRINNLVDAGNVLSINLFRSTAVLDYDKIEGDITIRIGKDDDIYEGIGRGIINVSRIPLYCDNVSPFGSPTSDTIRTSVNENTKKILLMIICFKTTDLKDGDRAIELFTKYCSATNIQKIEVRR